MLIDDLLVNLSLKCLNLKKLVSQEGAGETGLGVLAKQLDWEVSFHKEQAADGGQGEVGDKKSAIPALQFQ